MKTKSRTINALETKLAIKVIQVSRQTERRINITNYNNNSNGFLSCISTNQNDQSKCYRVSHVIIWPQAAEDMIHAKGT